MTDDTPTACAGCDHDPTCGNAKVHTSNGTRLFCRADDHDCFESETQRLADR